MSERGAVTVRLDVARCPECGACLDLAPLLLARDLAIVSALLQDLGMDDPPSLKRRAGKLVERLAAQSVALCTDLGFYGDDYLGEEAPSQEADAP